MYPYIFRSCVISTSKHCSNALNAVHCKSVPLKFRFFTQPFSSERNIAIEPKCTTVTETECTGIKKTVDDNKNKSLVNMLKLVEKYDQKLAELFKDEKNRKYYNRLELEVEFIRNIDGKVPSSMNSYNWYMLFTSPTRTRRRSYLTFLWRKEIIKEKSRERKEHKLSLVSERQELTDTNPYGLGKQTMFLRINDQKIMNFYNHRLISAMLHAPTIIFDFGLEKYMTAYEIHNCAKQLLLAFSANRLHHDPMNIQFCNVSKDSSLIEHLNKVIPTIFDETFPLTINAQSYLDLFDKDQLVYLTPHANYEMHEFDSSLVYIIGAMVDKINPRPLTLAKAKREGIKMMKFPLSHYLPWGRGSGKNLPLNQVLSILLDLKCTNDWKKALYEHIPKRKLKPARDKALARLTEKRSALLKSLMDEKISPDS